ncbi:puromycin N-acetyltransferase [Achaetomium macrosporum]|uniref:Puromycin N-acetyltransferase n=1 Tax=Achaetomium macrosporum TaxID=79813 RepID=A0AAN7C1M2_9PEZI|nr:puromycin N-acetyltransferase [Achaetomium macrosporum]
MWPIYGGYSRTPLPFPTIITFSIRPATYSDLPAIIRLYLADFWDEQLMDLLHPFRDPHPADFRRFINDMLTERRWTLGLEQCVDALVADAGRVVGFAWWRRSWNDEQRRRNIEGWLTVRRWFSPLIISLIQLRTKLWPYTKRALPALLPLLQSPPSRQRAWLLLTLAVDPAFQNKGLGTLLVQHGLSRGLERWYGHFGFVEKGRENIGELARWHGGAVMFREREQS